MSINNKNSEDKFDEPIEGFNAVAWSRQAKREFGKKWSDENGNPDVEKLKKILRQE
ncbi:MAG TPA: hypothetical protein VK074_05815 [Fodinibius sp.]|nr:hypothetical protein [Fodinibius sp.]